MKETKKELSSVRSDEFATKFEHVLGFCACSVDSIYRGVLDTTVNPDKCGRHIFNLNTLRVDVQIFKYATENSRIQKCPDMCGRGLNKLSLSIKWLTY